VFGREYVPMTRLAAHRERGVASWYGRKFHGRRTASGEVYDMYAMTAAHPTLPIPSYVRVTHLRNGRSVVVRVNDRGPFLHGRVIDLSYTAALRLDYVRAGSAEVEVELILPGALQPPVDRSLRAASGESAVVPALHPTASHAEAPISGTPRAGATYLQLGAFSTRERAASAHARFRRELAWLDVPLGVVEEGGLFKLRAGPWTDRAQALRAAERIGDALAERPLAIAR
jgi:rare lipoprotein A